MSCTIASVNLALVIKIFSIFLYLYPHKKRISCHDRYAKGTRWSVNQQRRAQVKVGNLASFTFQHHIHLSPDLVSMQVPFSSQVPPWKTKGCIIRSLLEVNGIVNTQIILLVSWGTRRPVAAWRKGREQKGNSGLLFHLCFTVYHSVHGLFASSLWLSSNFLIHQAYSLDLTLLYSC